jgi:hypothetical protein
VRSIRVIAPRRMWASIADAARELGCVHEALYRYIERRGEVWVFKPLDEQAYQSWHRTVYEREQRRHGRRPGGHRGRIIYDEAGDVFALSVAHAAAQLGVTPQALYHHMTPHINGYRLVSRPNLDNLGRRRRQRVKS